MSVPPFATRRRRLLPLAAAVVAAVALVAAACGGGSGDAGGPASFVPSGSPFYVDFSADLSSSQWQQADELLQRFPSAPAGGVDALVQDAFQEQGLDFEAQIQPILGERGALAALATPTVSADPDALSSGSVNNAVDEASGLAVFELAEDQEDAAVTLLTSEGDYRQAGERGGITYYSSGSDDFAAVDSDALVLADTEETLLSALEAKGEGGDATLAGSDKFDSAMGQLPEDALARAYLDFEPLLGQASDAGDNLGLGESLQQIQNAALGATATAEADGLSVKGVLVGFPEVGSQTAFSPGEPYSAPANAVAYFRFFDLSAAVSQAVTELRQNAEGDTAQQIDALSTQLPAVLGVTLDQLGALVDGQIELVITPGRAGVPGLGLVATVTDAAAAEETLDRLRVTGTQALAGQLGGGQGLEWRPVTLANGVRGWQLPVSDDFDLVYAVDGDRVIVASSPLTARTLQAPATSLAENEAFQTATQGIPSEVTSLFWLDTASTILVAQGADAIPPDQREALRNLRTTQGLAFWTTGGEEPTFDVFVPFAD